MPWMAGRAGWGWDGWCSRVFTTCCCCQPACVDFALFLISVCWSIDEWNYFNECFPSVLRWSGVLWDWAACCLEMKEVWYHIGRYPWPDKVIFIVK